MKRRIATVLSCMMVLVFILQAVPVTARAESYVDPAPVIQPTNANGQSILFDNTPGQTAGAAAWVIDGGFSDYANALANNGYVVTELRKGTPIEYSDLASYDVFVIPEANIPYKTTEQAAILQYVQNGGSVFFVADHYNADRNKNRWDASEVFNGYRRGAYADPTAGMSAEEASSEAMSGVESSDWLADNFGVRFRYNALGDINANMIVSPDECFGITNNVSSVAMHAGSTVAIIDPTIAKGIVYLPSGLTSSDRWSNAVDDGVYNGGGIEEGAYVAIAKVGAGKAAFIGDSSAVEDASPKYRREETGGTKKTYDGFSEVDDAILLTQLTDLLNRKAIRASPAKASRWIAPQSCTLMRLRVSPRNPRQSLGLLLRAVISGMMPARSNPVLMDTLAVVAAVPPSMIRIPSVPPPRLYLARKCL